MRCLACGYPVQHASEYRCPECGAQFPFDTLQRWFGGEEQQRLGLIQWLVFAGLFLNLWVIPQIAPFARLATGAVLGLACFHAGRGRFDLVGGYFAGAGIAAALLMMAFSCGMRAELPYYTLSTAGAALLMLAILHDSSGRLIWGHSATRPTAFGLLLAAPLLALIGYGLESVLGGSAGGGGATPLPHTLFHVALPGLASLGAWIWLAVRLHKLRRLYFAQPAG